MPPQTLVIDCKLSPFYLTAELVDSLSVLEPFGAMNPPAVFGIYKMNLVSVTPLSEGKHIRLELEKKGRKIRVVKFNTPYDSFPYQPGDVLNLAVKISKNLYKEKVYLSVQAVDIKLAGVDDDRYFEEKNDYELYRLTKKAKPSLYPEREDCAMVYKYIKKNNGYAYSLDDLYFRLQDKISYGALMFAIKAFVQSGLIEYNEKITLNPVNSKVNLQQTEILKSLKGRLNIE